jgi:hypothetical protein
LTLEPVAKEQTQKIILFGIVYFIIFEFLFKVKEKAIREKLLSQSIVYITLIWYLFQLNFILWMFFDSPKVNVILEIQIVVNNIKTTIIIWSLNFFTETFLLKICYLRCSLSEFFFPTSFLSNFMPKLLLI